MELEAFEVIAGEGRREEIFPSKRILRNAGLAL
jgi:hypothetical protein